MTKVCLVGIDGLRLPIGLEESPTLHALAEHGARTDLTMEVPTDSGPGWSTLLTGTTHAEHGVLANSFCGHRLWSHPDLLSRAFYLDQSLVTFAAADWPPLVDPAGIGPVIQARVEQQRAEQHRVIVRDGETYGYRTMDAEIASEARAALSGGPDVSFVYLGEADEAAHLHGVGDDYRAAIRRIDASLDLFAGIIEQRAEECGEDWLLVVTTDHGHLDEGGHGGDSPVERASFTLARRFGGRPLEWPPSLAPQDLVGVLLEYVAGRH